MESMAEKVELLSEVLQVESMSQQVCELSRDSEELQQSIKMRLQSLEDANKVLRGRKKDLFTFIWGIQIKHYLINALSLRTIL